MSPTSSALVANVNSRLTGHDRAIGIEICEASSDRVEAKLVVGDRHRQIHGVVHGGVYASLVETAGSVGALLALRDKSRAIVGLENHTSFLRAVRDGTLRIVAEPLTRGLRTQVWEVKIWNDQGKLAATGRLRVLCLEAGADLAGGRSQGGFPDGEGTELPGG